MGPSPSTPLLPAQGTRSLGVPAQVRPVSFRRSGRATGTAAESKGSGRPTAPLRDIRRAGTPLSSARAEHAGGGADGAARLKGPLLASPERLTPRPERGPGSLTSGGGEASVLGDFYTAGAFSKEPGESLGLYEQRSREVEGYPRFKVEHPGSFLSLGDSDTLRSA